jgi:hypothetical protein
LRQFSSHYTFHAGQNLPDKEFRYLRTIIVIADVHWRFGDWREPLPLTFQHWSGVTPYTSPCGLAESCVFGKQSVGKLSLRPTRYRAGKASCKRTPSFFAEFLNEDSPVRLGLLALSTCVGLRYGRSRMNLRSFSRHPAPLPFPALRQRSERPSDMRSADLPAEHPQTVHTNPIRCEGYRDASLHRIRDRCRNIDLLSIDYAFRPRLRTD